MGIQGGWGGSNRLTMQENGRSAVTDGMFAFERRAVGSLVSFLHRRSPGRCRLRERPSEYLVILSFDAVVRRRPDNGRPPRVGAQAHIPHDRGRGQRRFGTLPPVEGRLPQSGKAKRGDRGESFPPAGSGAAPQCLSCLSVPFRHEKSRHGAGFGSKRFPEDQTSVAWSQT